MSQPLTFTVYGTPAPQGSKKGFVVNGRAVLVDDNKTPLRTWREDLKTAAMRARNASGGRSFPTGPIRLAATFYMPRPKSHYGTRRGQSYLRPNAPVWVDKKPDTDKTARALADALTAAGVYRDDAQIAELHAVMKYAAGRYAELDRPGAIVTVAPMTISFDDHADQALAAAADELTARALEHTITRHPAGQQRPRGAT